MRNAGSVHGLQEVEDPAHIVVPEAKRKAFALADLDIGREVHHRVGSMVCEGALKIAQDAHISLHQRPPPHRMGVTGGQIIEHHRRVAARGERLADMRSDIAGSADHQHLDHGQPLPSRRTRTYPGARVRASTSRRPHSKTNLKYWGLNVIVQGVSGAC